MTCPDPLSATNRHTLKILARHDEVCSSSLDLHARFDLFFNRVLRGLPLRSGW